MKKVLVLALSLMLVACGGTPSSSAQPANAPASSEASTSATPASGVKLGLALVSGNEKSKDASDVEGVAQTDSIAVALMLDEAGKILDIEIDTLQSIVKFDNTGSIVTDLATEFKTKKELGDDYKMRPASKIGREWNEQAESLEHYVIGKTVEEVSAIAINEAQYPTDTELTASVTMKIGGYLTAIQKAAATAIDTVASPTDKLGLAVVMNLDSSKNAGEADGLVHSYQTFAAVTVGEDGKITGTIIDCAQGKVNFDATGKITTDLTVPVKSKHELKDAYNMRAASGIGMEWFEQAIAYQNYVIGMTADEVAGIAITEEGIPTDAELLAGVTIDIIAFNEALLKAVAKAV